MRRRDSDFFLSIEPALYSEWINIRSLRIEVTSCQYWRNWRNLIGWEHFHMSICVDEWIVYYRGVPCLQIVLEQFLCGQPRDSEWIIDVASFIRYFFAHIIRNFYAYRLLSLFSYRYYRNLVIWSQIHVRIESITKMWSASYVYLYDSYVDNFIFMICQLELYCASYSQRSYR